MIRLENVSWSAGAFTLEGISLEIPDASYAILMGPTGCGKTTVLEIIAGLRQPIKGRVYIGERDVTRLPSGRRRLGYVPQDGALFPTMKVWEQLGFALRLRRIPSTEIAATVEILADSLEIRHLLGRSVNGLSGGERQRVALGRALAAKPDALILDEPLSALDEDTRGSMMALLKRMQREFAIPALHVTHSQTEALGIGDKIFRFSGGKIVEEPHTPRKP